MRFKLYMLMLEWPHYFTTRPLEIHDPKMNKRFTFDLVDFRVEDWVGGGNLSPDPGHKKALFEKRISFSAKLPDGSYLNVSIPSTGAPSLYAQAEMVGIKQPPPVNVYIGYDAPDNAFVIPDNIDWYSYAAFFLQDNLVKAPRIMRDDDKANLVRQEREGKTKPQFQFTGDSEVQGPIQPVTRPMFRIAQYLLP